MEDEPRLVFGPTGTPRELGQNKVEVFLSTPEGEIHLQIPAPGALAKGDDRVRYMLGVIDLALARLLEARAREDRDPNPHYQANGGATHASPAKLR